MKDPRDVILRPIVTEKAAIAQETQNKYTFEVHKSASKPEIRDAIEEIFEDVKVSSVNTLNRKGKRSRNRRTNRFNKRADRKRAIVTLAEGSIDVFES